MRRELVDAGPAWAVWHPAVLVQSKTGREVAGDDGLPVRRRAEQGTLLPGVGGRVGARRSSHPNLWVGRAAAAAGATRVVTLCDELADGRYSTWRWEALGGSRFRHGWAGVAVVVLGIVTAMGGSASAAQALSLPELRC